jgi:hypothetical protein
MQASALFLRTAVMAAVVGMGLGIGMGISQDYALHSVHAHTNLVGWTSMFLFGLYYRLAPAADGRLALVQYLLSVAGFLLLTTGLTGISLGQAIAFTQLAVAGSLLTFGSMAIFVWNVFSTTGSTRVGRPVRFERRSGEPAPSGAPME